MTAIRVGVVDYGVGNLRSVANALIAVGAEPCVSSDRQELSVCDRIILPGVGAFPHGRKALETAGLDGFLQDVVAGGMELLGICLGMQMLVDASSEFTETAGLGLIPGRVASFQPTGKGSALRLPHVGWAPAIRRQGAEGLITRLFDDIDKTALFYFIHSYAVMEDNPAVAAVSTYEDQSFGSVIAAGNVVGTQFHPEKSGSVGLRLLKNFVS